MGGATVELLEKTRKINKLLQRGEKVEFNAIARLLKEVIVSNVYIVGRKARAELRALRCWTILNVTSCASRCWI